MMESDNDYESDGSVENDPVRKQSVPREEDDVEDIENNLTREELKKQILYQKLLQDADEKLNNFKSKVLSQLSEAFKLFDMDRDGVIGEEDLKFTFATLGENNVSDQSIRKMINESSTPIDLKTFVSMFESKETEFDSAIDLIKAFSKWDNTSCGCILEDRIKTDLQKTENKLSEKEIECALEEAPVYGEDGKTVIDYIEFSANICGMQKIQDCKLYQEKISKI